MTNHTHTHTPTNHKQTTHHLPIHITEMANIQQQHTPHHTQTYSPPPQPLLTQFQPQQEQANSKLESAPCLWTDPEAQALLRGLAWVANIWAKSVGAVRLRALVRCFVGVNLSSFGPADGTLLGHSAALHPPHLACQAAARPSSTGSGRRGPRRTRGGPAPPRGISQRRELRPA